MEPRTTSTEVFRLKVGSFSTTAQTFQDITNACGNIVFTTPKISWHLIIAGHFVDGSAKTMRFRIKFVDPREGAHHYWPSDDGAIKYMYVDHSRLEVASFQGVSSVPLGNFSLQCQVACGSEGGSYSWNGVYGEITLLVSTATEPPHSYDSGWIFVSSVSSNTVVLHHNLGTPVISRYTILYAESNNPDEVYDVTNNSHYCTNHAQYSGAIHGGVLEIYKGHCFDSFVGGR